MGIKTFEEYKEYIKDFFCMHDLPVRVCTHCENLMISGFVVNEGEEYYCSETCLHTKYSKKEWTKMYDEGKGDSYYTEF